MISLAEGYQEMKDSSIESGEQGQGMKESKGGDGPTGKKAQWQRKSCQEREKTTVHNQDKKRIESAQKRVLKN